MTCLVYFFCPSRLPSSLFVRATAAGLKLEVLGDNEMREHLKPSLYQGVVLRRHLLPYILLRVTYVI
jgi:hypothetical protein